MYRLKSAMASLLLIAGLMISASAAAQTPARFDFTFQDPGGPATATGFIVFDLDLLPNPGMTGFFPLPDPRVLDIEITITGATTGNGLFVFSDFTQVTWDTGGLTLDLGPGVEVIGQPTTGGTWGDTSCGLDGSGPDGGGPGGLCGDFNLFTNPLGPAGSNAYVERGGPGSGPQGVNFFTLATDGGAGDNMELVSFARIGPAAPSFSVPALSWWSISLFSALLLVFGALAVRLRA